MPAERARAIVELSVSGQSNVDRAMQKVVNRTRQLEQANMGQDRIAARHSRIAGELRGNLSRLRSAHQRRLNDLTQEGNALRKNADAQRAYLRQLQTDKTQARTIRGATARQNATRQADREIVKTRRLLDETTDAIRRNEQAKRDEKLSFTRDQTKINSLVAERVRLERKTRDEVRKNNREIKRQQHEARRLRSEAQMGVNTMSQVAMVSGNVLIGVGGALSAGLYVASRGILSYNTVLNETAAVSGATAEEIRLLDRQARQLGLTTEKSASEAAAGQRELGRAGFQVNETLAATPGVLALSTIGNIEMGRSSEYLAGTLRQFELDAKSSNRVVDVFAQAVTSSLFNVEGLGVALGTAGPLAHQFNIPLERTVALLSTVRSAGVGPARTGTGLRSFLAAVANMSQGDVQKLANVGVEAQNLTDLLMAGDISGIGRMLENVDAAVLTNVFGTEASNVTAIIAAQNKEIDRMEQVLLNSAGAAEQMREVMNTGVVGAFREARSAADSLVLSLGDSGLTGGLTVSADVAKTGLRFFDKLPGPFKTLASYLVLSGPLIVGAGVGLRLFAAATQHATISQIKMNAALTANNIGLVAMRNRAVGAAQSLGAMKLGAVGGGVLALGVGLGILTWHLNNVREAAAGAFDSASAAVQRNIEALSTIPQLGAALQKQVDAQSKTLEQRRMQTEESRRENLAALESERTGVLQALSTVPSVVVDAYGMTARMIGSMFTGGMQRMGEMTLAQAGLVERPPMPMPGTEGVTPVVTAEVQPYVPRFEPTDAQRLWSFLGLTDDPRRLNAIEKQAERQLMDIDLEARNAAARYRGLAQRGFLEEGDGRGETETTRGGTLVFQQPFADDFFAFGEDVGGGRIVLQFIVDGSSREGQDLLRVAEAVAGGLGE